MNDMNWLEKQLASWEPRRPSAKIERRLFPKRERAADLTRALAWLAPVAACMMLALATVRQDPPGPVATPGSEYLFAMVLSNQLGAGFLPDCGEQAENRVMRASFDWTNRGNSGSSIRLMPLTNSTD
jgi:hypothetical protein